MGALSLVLLASVGTADSYCIELPEEAGKTTAHRLQQIEKDIELIAKRYQPTQTNAEITNAVIVLVDKIIDNLCYALSESNNGESATEVKDIAVAEKLFDELSEALSLPPIRSDAKYAEFATEEMIQSLFDRRKEYLYKIYNAFLAENYSLRGHVVYSITFHRSGLVDKVALHGVDDGLVSVARAIIPVIYTIRLPELSSQTQILYPIDFMPTGTSR